MTGSERETENLTGRVQTRQSHAHAATPRSETTEQKPADADFPGQEELDAAIDHFSFSAGRIGAPAEYKRPFTRQLKSDTALRFEVDKQYFAQADQVERSVVGSYLLLRAVTFLLFLAAVLVQDWLFRRNWDADLSAAPPFLKTSIATASIVAVSAAALGLRLFIRWVWFRELSRRANQLSFQIFRRLDDINTRVTEVCAKVRDRVGKGGDWPTRARKWTIVALWNAKRGEYLDRFVTTVIWKVRTSISEIEAGSLILKFLLAIAVAGMALLQEHNTAAGVFGLFLLGQTYLFWHWFGRQPEDFWTVQFRKSAPAGDHDGETYVDKISGVVENLVHEAFSKEFGQGGGKKP